MDKPASSGRQLSVVKSTAVVKRGSGLNHAWINDPDMIKAIRISEKTTTEEAFFSLPAVNVQQALTFLFLMKRWNRGDFFKHTLRSEKSFDRIVNNDKRKVRLGTILAYAFALDYGQMVGAYLIVLAGYKLSDVPYGYIRLMADFRHHSLPEVREYALSQNLPDVLGEDINA